MTTHHARQYPVILITGTPGTGKTLHATLLSQTMDDTDAPLVDLNIGEIVKEKGLHEGWNDEWQSWTVDEDRLLDYLEEVINPESGPAAIVYRTARQCLSFILDHHDPGLFPERWIDLAVVLTCDNKVLHERLTAREYPANKITENITAEIMETCLSETHESYAPEIIVQLRSDGQGGGEGEADENVKRIADWVEAWRKDRIEGRHEVDEDG